MIRERTLKISVPAGESMQDVDVRLRYCAAAENNFEKIAGHSITEIEFRQMGDVLAFVYSCILAAYEKDGMEPPVDMRTILYEIGPEDIKALVRESLELRNEWYELPPVVSEAVKKESSEDEPKNA